MIPRNLKTKTYESNTTVNLINQGKSSMILVKQRKPLLEAYS